MCIVTESLCNACKAIIYLSVHFSVNVLIVILFFSFLTCNSLTTHSPDVLPPRLPSNHILLLKYVFLPINIYPTGRAPVPPGKGGRPGINPFDDPRPVLPPGAKKKRAPPPPTTKTTKATTNPFDSD